ncbi:MAG: molybdate ABC transporter substrate-binding protein [Pseudomonadota bacterium]
MTRHWITELLLVLTLAACLPMAAVAQPAKPPTMQARIAVAANFADAARKLAADYAKQSGQKIEISSASTGKLYAQIVSGAPFDALLSADAETPRKLVDAGLADASTLHDYATGRLVLWSRDPARVTDGEALLRKGPIERLAIANPDLAPYGAAAREVLQHVRRWEELKPRLVMGENINQASQFVITGAAPLGLLPRSLAMEANRKHRGSSWEIPAAWHAPIVQSAVLLKRGERNPAARGFLVYLRSPAAQKQIRNFGYD